MNIDEQISRLLRFAENTNSDLELVIEADINDADYVYSLNKYSVEDFIEYDMTAVYKFFKRLEEDYIAAEEAWENNNVEEECKIRERYQYIIENIRQKDKMTGDYANLWVSGLDEFLPNGTVPEDEVHTITKVRLRAVYEL